MTLPQLPPLPQKLPKTQAEWDALVVLMQAWQQTLGPLLQLLDTSPATSATAGSITPPTKVTGYLTTTISGTTYKIALYKP